MSGRIRAQLGPPGNDPGLTGGFVLSSGHDDKKPDRKRGTTPVQSKDRDMGSALRSIYQKTIEEAVPDEMLSLLGKLD
jgi:Anti-sigma factor NepR